MSRIIAGTAKGRTLVVPKSGTRPTSDRVRESLFSILNSRVEWDELRALDLFAGSGALGLEAVSRGAAAATLVDKAPAAVTAMTKNAEALGFVDSVEIVRSEVASWIHNASVTNPFSLVFLDPPYELANDSLKSLVGDLADSGLLADCALVVVERAVRGESFEFSSEHFEPVVERKYGDTLVTIGEFVGSGQ